MVLIYDRCSATTMMKTIQGTHISSFSSAVFREPFTLYHQSGVTELQSWMSENSENVTGSISSVM